MSSTIVDLPVQVLWLKNPFDPYEVERDSAQSGLTIREYLEQVFGEDFTEFDRPTLCLLNGIPMMRHTWHTEKLRPNDVLTFATLAGWELVIYAVIAIVVAVAVILIMDNPVIPGTQKTADSVYNYSGQKNKQKMDEPIEVPYGLNRLFPSYGAMIYTVYSGNEQINFSLYVVGQGHYDLANTIIQIEDTPIGSFQDATAELVPPGSQVTLFPDNVVTSIEVSNIELFGPNQVEYDGWSGPYVVNPPGTKTNRIEYDYTFPMGLFAQYEGSILKITVTHEFAYQEIDDLGNPVGAWVSHGTITTQKRTNTPQRFTQGYDMTPARYQVRGRRTNVKNMNVAVNSTLTWESVRAFLPSTKDYGDLTMLAVRIRASNNINNNSQQRVNLITTRCLPTWDPTGGIDGDGGWTDPIPTRSIVWAFCDVFRAEYGGVKLEDEYFDMDHLLWLEDYFEEKGWHFDFVFDTAMTIYDAVKTIARAGRCVFLPVGSKVSMVLDHPKTLTSAVFSPENIIRDSFSAEYKLFEPDAIDHVIVLYKDPITFQEEEVICTMPGFTQLNADKVTFAGCLDRNHAYREGMYILAQRLYVRDSIKFRTGQEGHLPTYGDRIAVYHDVPQFGLGSGFVLAIDGDELHLSEGLNYYTGDTITPTYVMILRTRNGSAAGPFTVTPGVDPNHCHISPAPNPDDYIFDNFNEPPIYLFGLQDMQELYLKVVEISPSDDDTVEITAVNYTDKLFVYDQADAPPKENPTVPTPIPDLPVVLEISVVVDPYNMTYVGVGWTPAFGATSYVLQQSADGETWDDVITQVGTNYLLPITEGQGETWLRVAGINTGVGPWKVWTGDLGIPLNPPGSPANLIGSYPDDGVHASWDPTSGAGGYRVSLYKGATLLRQESIPDLSYIYNFTKFALDGAYPARDIKVEVLAVNANGESPPSVVNVTNALPPVPDTVAASLISGTNYKLDWSLPTPITDLDKYRVYADATPAFTPSVGNRIYEGIALTTNYDTGGATRYWKVATMDKWGSEEVMSIEREILGMTYTSLIAASHRAWITDGYTNWITSVGGNPNSGNLLNWTSSDPSATNRTAGSGVAVGTATALKRWHNAYSGLAFLSADTPARCGLVFSARSNGIAWPRHFTMTDGTILSINYSVGEVVLEQAVGGLLRFGIPLATNTWYVFAIVWGATAGDVKVWVNGVLKPITSGTYNPASRVLSRTGNPSFADCAIGDMIILNNPTDALMVDASNLMKPRWV